MSKVLLVGMSKKNNSDIEKIFSSVKVSCVVAPSFDNAFEKIPGDPPSLVIAEKPDQLDALYSLQAVLKTNAPATSFLIFLKKPSAEEAMNVLKTGAFDCLAYPYNKFRLLAAAKRATSRQGRTLFVDKVIQKRLHIWPYILSAFFSILIYGFGMKLYNGPPPNTISLGSANLSGLQWEDRHLWVADWFDSTVTFYRLNKGFFKKGRTLETEGMFHMQDAQPILLGNTPDALISISADLKMRSHQWAVGLPTLQTVQAPSTNPTGLAWDGQNIWSSDRETQLLYRHGSDLRVIDVVKSIVAHPVGLASDGKSMWVLGSSPLNLARLEITEKGHVWSGPYPVRNLLTEGIVPSGMAIGFERLWLVSGGEPRMVSRSLREIMKESNGWTKPAGLPKEK